MSEGLLLFTNNGDFARRYELPSSKILRVYRVCINGDINPIDLKNINKDLDDKPYVYSETGALQGPFPSPEKPNVFCIKSKKHKLIYLKTSEKWELYNLEDDPKEQKNIFDTGIYEEHELKSKLLTWIERD